MSDTRIALVTGANQGVGFQVAKALAANDITVYVGARNLKHARPPQRRSGQMRSLSTST
jgi:NAD(P)-dependent dehydrogenase (short-subunit alcohol dehydrogenase family)